MKDLATGILAASAVIWFGLAAWAWGRRGFRAGRPAAGLFFCVALYSAAYLAGLLSSPYRVGPLWFTTAIQYIGLAFLPLALMRTVLDYTARSGWLSRLQWRFLLGVSAALAVLKALDPAWRLIYQDLEVVNWGGLAVARFDPGPLYWLMAVYTHGGILISLAAITRVWRSEAPIFRRQLVGLMAACLLPAGGHVAYLAGWISRPGLEPNPYFLSVSLLFVLWVVFHRDFVSPAPLARDVVMDGLDEAVLVFDRERRLIDANEPARVLLAMRKENLGRRAEDLLAEWPEILGFLSKAAAARETVEIRRRNSLSWALQQIPLRLGFMETGLALVIRDETQRRMEDESRARLERRILQLQKTESLTALAGGIAHEFNNLLMAVLGNFELLRSALPQEGDSAAALTDAEQAARRAAELSRLMLDYSGHGNQRSERVDLSQLVRDLEPDLKAKLAPGIRLDVETESGVEIQGDPDQIRKVVRNLVANAAESVAFQAQGAITVRISRGRETDGESGAGNTAADLLPGDYARLSVRDTGCGIDPEWLPLIFDPFFSTRVAGHGLGLAAVQGIALSHGGGVRVESERGKGSLFRVFFPLANSAEGGS